jgi:glycosyltransferase involved in cell wall biosynthesis
MGKPLSPPQVTVVLPTFNRPWGLRRALRAVLAQTYPHLQVIVMDDCSGDDTPAAMREFVDPRVLYFRQSHNVGVGRNWGDGLRRARTPYVCFLMDDDYPDPTFLETRIRLLERCPDAQVAFSGYRRVRPDGSLLGETRPSCRDEDVYDSSDLLRIFLEEARVFVGAMLYRRDAVMGLWDRAERYDLVVDLALNLNLMLRPGVRGVYTGALDFNVSIHDGQMITAGGVRVYQLTEAVLSDQRRRAVGQVASFLRVNQAAFLMGWAFMAVDRDRRVAFTRLLKSIALAPFTWRLWRRRLYILSLILGIRTKPAPT